MADNNCIRVSSFNCRNVKSSITEIQQLCNDNDILLLQETWLTEDEGGLLNNVSKYSYAKGISAMDTSRQIIHGRRGGLAILWRKSLASSCSLLTYDDTRIMGIKISTDKKSFLILNVYLPYNDGSNLEDLMFYFGKIDSIIDGFPSPYVYVCGEL